VADPVRPPRTTLQVRYNPPVAWLFLVLGIANFVLGLLVPGLINLALGALFIVYGAVLLTRPYFTYTTHTRTLEVIAPIGTRRSFRATGGDTLIVAGNRIVLVKADGKRKKIPVNRWMSRANEWEIVTEAISHHPKPT